MGHPSGIAPARSWSNPPKPAPCVSAIASRPSGHPYVVGIQQCLRNGLCRLSVNQSPAALAEPEQGGPLRLAGRIQELSRAEAIRHPPVNLRGVVTWSHPATPFIYVLDASGGVRVLNPNWQGHDTQRPGSIVNLRGAVAEGDFCPRRHQCRTDAPQLLESRARPRSSASSRPSPAPRTATGFKMRGLVRKVSYSNQLARLEMGAPSGSFVVWTPRRHQPFARGDARLDHPRRGRLRRQRQRSPPGRRHRALGRQGRQLPDRRTRSRRFLRRPSARVGRPPPLQPPIGFEPPRPHRRDRRPSRRRRISLRPGRRRQHLRPSPSKPSRSSPATASNSSASPAARATSSSFAKPFIAAPRAARNRRPRRCPRSRSSRICKGFSSNPVEPS